MADDTVDGIDRDHGSVVFFHAHPDDESIFSGGTIRRLADSGRRVVVVLATNGSADPSSVEATMRVDEARVACAVLGVHRLVTLGHGDSGLWADAAPGQSFWSADTRVVAAQLADVLRDEEAGALVVYDDHGIYGHPDHIAVHRVGMAAAVLAGTPTVYECTVDREYLHFVETHLVGHAVESLLGAPIGSTNTAPLGVPTVLVGITVDVREQQAAKRSAMAAHVSQIPAESEALGMDAATFEGVYGYEWYTRVVGPPGPLEPLGF
jgi:LmbE family N-acetylglucosaminyl deacetylase